MIPENLIHKLSVSSRTDEGFYMMDEIHLFCRDCTYKRAVPLKIDKKLDGNGIRVREGNGADHQYMNVIYND